MRLQYIVWLSRLIVQLYESIDGCVRWAKIGKEISDESIKSFGSHLREFVHACVCQGKTGCFEKGMILFLATLITSDRNMYGCVEGLRMETETSEEVVAMAPEKVTRG